MDCPKCTRPNFPHVNVCNYCGADLGYKPEAGSEEDSRAAPGSVSCARCAALNDLLRELFTADDEYGSGFYNTDRWREAYDKLREMTPNGQAQVSRADNEISTTQERN